MIKATNVDGVYSADPRSHDDAEFIPRLTYRDVLTRGLRVIDSTAVSLLMDNHIPVRVIDLGRPGNLKRVILGHEVGSLIS